MPLENYSNIRWLAPLTTRSSVPKDGAYVHELKLDHRRSSSKPHETNWVLGRCHLFPPSAVGKRSERSYLPPLLRASWPHGQQLRDEGLSELLLADDLPGNHSFGKKVEKSQPPG